MPNTKKQKGLLLLSKEKLDCYLPLSPQVLSLPFPTNIIRSMDVIDKNALNNHIKTFIQTNKLPPAEFSLVIHESLLFEKLFTRTDTKVPESATQPSTDPLNSSGISTASQTAAVQPAPVPTPPVPSQTVQPVKNTKPTQSQMEEEEDKIEKFIDTIPFEEVITKSIKSAQGTRVIVANKDLIACLKEAFVNEGFMIDPVVPVSLFGNEAHNVNNLTTQAAQHLLSQLEAGKFQTMFIDEKKAIEAQTGPVALGMPQKESEKKRLYLMVGVFLVLIVVLIFFYMKMNSENSTPPAPVSQQTAAPIQSATPTQLPAASSSAEMKSTLPIEITVSPARASLSAQLNESLSLAGYDAVTSSPGGVTAAVFVMFTAGVPQDIREELMAMLQQFDASAVAQQNADTQPGVTISF